MKKYVPHKNTKALSFRNRGRFAKAPSLETAGLVKVCEHCHTIIPRPEMLRDESTGFVDPRVPWPEDCPQCQQPLDAAQTVGKS